LSKEGELGSISTVSTAKIAEILETEEITVDEAVRIINDKIKVRKFDSAISFVTNSIIDIDSATVELVAKTDKMTTDYYNRSRVVLTIPNNGPGGFAQSQSEYDRTLNKQVVNGYYVYKLNVAKLLEGKLQYVYEHNSGYNSYYRRNQVGTFSVSLESNPSLHHIRVSGKAKDGTDYAFVI